MPARSRKAASVVLVTVCALVAGCSSSSEGSAAKGASATSASPGGSEVSGDVTVFAAASTADVAEELAAAFESRNPGVDVTRNVAGSQRLATQLLQGARADIYISANTTQMQRVVGDGLMAGEPLPFAATTMTIAVAEGNPKKITGVCDLANEDLTLVLGAEDVPAGAYAREVLARAGLEVSPDSNETNVRQALSKVRLGEADAAVVYRSDLVAVGEGVEGVGIREAVNTTATYRVARLEDAPNPEAGAAFLSFVRSAPAQERLARFGFSEPAGAASGSPSGASPSEPASPITDPCPDT